MEIQIEMRDMATPYLKSLVENNPKWLASALKSAAWKTQRAVKSGIQSGSPGGHPYSPLMPNKMRRSLESVLGGNVKSRYNPMGRLRMAVGYDSSKADMGVVTVGWLSHSAVYLGGKQQEGYSITVTDSLRRAFAAAGIKLGAGKTQLEVKSRPTFDPMMPVVRPIASKAVEAKLLSYVLGNNSRSSAASTRIYKVYK